MVLNLELNLWRKGKKAVGWTFCFRSPYLASAHTPTIRHSASYIRRDWPIRFSLGRQQAREKGGGQGHAHAESPNADIQG